MTQQGMHPQSVAPQPGGQLYMLPLLMAFNAVPLCTADQIVILALVAMKTRRKRTRTTDIMDFTRLNVNSVHVVLRKLEGWKWLTKRRLGLALQDGVAWSLTPLGKRKMEELMAKGREAL